MNVNHLINTGTLWTKVSSNVNYTLFVENELKHENSPLTA